MEQKSVCPITHYKTYSISNTRTKLIWTSKDFVDCYLSILISTHAKPIFFFLKFYICTMLYFNVQFFFFLSSIFVCYISTYSRKKEAIGTLKSLKILNKISIFDLHTQVIIFLQLTLNSSMFCFYP